MDMPVQGMNWGNLVEYSLQIKAALSKALVREKAQKEQIDLTMFAITPDFYTEVNLGVKPPRGLKRSFTVEQILIDGGATINGIAGTAVDALGLKVYEKSTYIVKVDGRSQQLYHAADLHFRIADALTTAKAFVIEGSMLFTILLGHPWLWNMKAQGFYGEDASYIPNREGELVELPVSGEWRQKGESNSAGTSQNAVLKRRRDNGGGPITESEIGEEVQGNEDEDKDCVMLTTKVHSSKDRHQ